MIVMDVSADALEAELQPYLFSYTQTTQTKMSSLDLKHQVNSSVVTVSSPEPERTTMEAERLHTDVTWFKGHVTFIYKVSSVLFSLVSFLLSLLRPGPGASHVLLRPQTSEVTP